MKKLLAVICSLVLLVSGVAMFSACTISYKFNGASIDYTKIKSISIKDFPNQAPLVYPPLSQMFTEALKDLDKYGIQTNGLYLRQWGERTRWYEIVPMMRKNP